MPRALPTVVELSTETVGNGHTHCQDTVHYSQSHCYSGKWPHPLPGHCTLQPITVLQWEMATPPARTLYITANHSATVGNGHTHCQDTVHYSQSQCYSGKWTHPLPGHCTLQQITVLQWKMATPTARTLYITANHSATVGNGHTHGQDTVHYNQSQCYSGKWPHPLPGHCTIQPITVLQWEMATPPARALYITTAVAITLVTISTPNSYV